MSATVTIHEYLREAMRDRGWNVPRLAEACEVSLGLAAKWVSDNPRYRVVPSPASCRKIADALGVDRDEVLARAGHREAKEPDQPSPVRLSAAQAALLAAYNAVPPAVKPHAHRAAVGALRAFVRDKNEKPGDRSAASARPRFPIAA